MNYFKISEDGWDKFHKIIFAVIFCRVIAILFFENYRIVNDSGINLNFAGAPAYLDYWLYKNHSEIAFSQIFRPLTFINLGLAEPAKAWDWLRLQNISPGPIFPLMLGIFDYEFERITLATFYLFQGAALGVVWAWIAAIRGGKFWIQLLLSCFPALVYYSFIVSTDLLYATLIGAFFIFSGALLNGTRKVWSICSFVLILAILTRPNGISMIPVIMILVLRDQEFSKYLKLILMIFWSFIGLYMLIYYLPYFWIHENNSIGINYWGFSTVQFKAGLFDFMPIFINQLLSFILLIISKVTYAVGLRPSYSDVDIWLVLLRALPGFVLLPGLIHGLIRGHWFDIVFIFFFLIPIFVGATQERYILAITPLLMIWGVAFYAKLFERFRRFNKSRLNN